MEEFDTLKLENQLCFPLYVCSKEIIKKYQPYLDEINLTYTQYITMMVLWEKEKINVKNLGEKLFLDSGTLTPLLKKLEIKGYIKKEKLLKDERNVLVSITEEGKKIKDRAQNIPLKVSKCIHLNKKESIKLYQLLYKILKNISCDTK